MGGGETTYSQAALRALGTFGLTTTDVRDHASEHHQRAAIAAAHLDQRLRPGQIALIHGPSGCGKSTLLRAVAGVIVQRSGVVIAPPDLAPLMARRVIDLLVESAEGVNQALRTLAAAGLADAMIPARFARELSDGQRARLAIALAMHAAGAHPRATLLIDELASTLDDATGEGLCITLARWVRRTPTVRLIAATARDNAHTWLAPDLALVPPVDAALSVNRCPSANHTLRVSPGTIDDYRALAHLHYRAKAPATCVRVLVARLHHGRQAARATHKEGPPIGVLVVSMPTLNGSWRALAWPGEYDGRTSKRSAAARLNRDLRCISRLIVEPRYRARGVGGALVRAYLADPLTRRTEAVAAMGAACPVFLRAGMREWVGEPTWRDTRLIDTLDAAGLRPWMIADIASTLKKVERHPFLARAFRVWAGKHGATRALAEAPIEDVIRAAARSIVARARAYTAGE
ncbi:MAG TPA: ABC transporter ATP-binding protein [Phycisphaerales bacterium]|nr:ABC transporter ATP-binding protein [Phycisphaerales bacterium]